MGDESHIIEVKMQANRYKSYAPEEIINFANQKHLTTEEKGKLKRLLIEFEDFFDGTIGA